MGARVASLVLLSAFAVALGACSNDKPVFEQANVFPANYKAEVAQTLKALFQKNETIRVTGGMISAPVLQAVDKEQRYTACVHYTAHGIDSGDIGNATRVAYFYGGHLNQLIPAVDDQCKNAAYVPFLELDKVCLGKGCQ
jgi:hypothetical protein